VAGPLAGAALPMRDAVPAVVDAQLRTAVVVVFSMVAIAVTAVDVVQYTVGRASVLSPISGCACAGCNPVLSGRVSA
jgi:hypothetical protein